MIWYIKSWIEGYNDMIWRVSVPQDYNTIPKFIITNRVDFGLFCSYIFHFTSKYIIIIISPHPLPTPTVLILGYFLFQKFSNFSPPPPPSLLSPVTSTRVGCDWISSVVKGKPSNMSPNGGGGKRRNNLEFQEKTQQKNKTKKTKNNKNNKIHEQLILKRHKLDGTKHYSPIYKKKKTIPRNDLRSTPPLQI